MTYPLEFYCTSSDSHTKYGWTPKRGDPHVNRLISGQPYWPELGSRTITKKTLILADWTGQFWSLQKTEQVKTVLAQLIAEEFIIYLWQEGRVLPLCIDKLSSLDIDDIRHAMRPTPIQAIVEAAITQHKFTVDNIQVIDDYWVEHQQFPLVPTARSVQGLNKFLIRKLL